MTTKSYYDNYWSPNGTYPGGVVSERLWTTITSTVTARSTCLDYGCGDGEPLGTELAGLAGTYLGYDISEVAVERAQERGLDARLVNAGDGLDLPDASVDVALAIEVFEHLPEPQHAAGEIGRVLRPGGTLIATTPNVGYWRQRVDLAAGRWNPRGDAESSSRPWRDPHIRFFTRSSLSRMLAEAGFTEVTVGGTGGAFLADLPLLRRLARRRGSRLYALIERRLPGLLSGRLLATARKT